MMRFRRRLALLALAVLAPALGLGAAQADDATLTPFSASYRLEVKGWPNASIDHRLSRESGHWQSRMEAAIAVARGNEQSRFIVTPKGVRSVNYASGYSLLGVRGSYRLGSDELGERLDRQAALVELSRRAANGGCQATCRFVYQDHRGREESVDYRIVERAPLTLPAGRFDAVKVEVVDPETPDRQLLFHFHPEMPGLLLAAEYHREGERRSRLTLRALETEAPDPFSCR
ncbi:hypothetical protein [Halomonas sp. E14]|uniref:hypothetical protein n=1 Tax=Halomonas sp. E14 TaxID=3397245 RepID=UPI00403E8A9B